MNLIGALEDLIRTKSPCGRTHIIAIDGRAGAGKTTLANQLAFFFETTRKVSVIHLDELYAGWDLALGPTLTATLSHILASIEKEKDATVAIYDWSAGHFNSRRTFSPCDILIIEGVGAAQRVVRDWATATIWIDIDQTSGLRRVLDRDGSEIEGHMLRWQIQEEEHFRTDGTRESADFILSTL